VSDPTTPPNDPHRDDDAIDGDTEQLDSEPIDVKELLESTRKLFEPEELRRSMEQAGYIPPPVISAGEPDYGTEEDGADRADDEPETPSVGQRAEDERALESDETTLAPEINTAGAVDMAADEEPDVEMGHEEPPLKGLNILSVVAFVLALALSPLAVIFGYIALGQTRRARQRGETLALWAIGLGWLVFAAWVVLIASLIWIGYQQGITVDSLREFIELFSLP